MTAPKVDRDSRVATLQKLIQQGGSQTKIMAALLPIMGASRDELPSRASVEALRGGLDHIQELILKASAKRARLQLEAHAAETALEMKGFHIDLPVALLIVRMLDIRDRYTASIVSRDFHAVATSPHVWCIIHFRSTKGGLNSDRFQKLFKKRPMFAQLRHVTIPRMSSLSKSLTPFLANLLGGASSTCPHLESFSFENFLEGYKMKQETMESFVSVLEKNGTTGNLKRFTGPRSIYGPTCLPIVTKCTSLRVLYLSLVGPAHWSRVESQGRAADVFLAMSNLKSLESLTLEYPTYGNYDPSDPCTDEALAPVWAGCTRLKRLALANFFRLTKTTWECLGSHSNVEIIELSSTPGWFRNGAAEDLPPGTVDWIVPSIVCIPSLTALHLQLRGVWGDDPCFKAEVTSGYASMDSMRSFLQWVDKDHTLHLDPGMFSQFTDQTLVDFSTVSLTVAESKRVDEAKSRGFLAEQQRSFYGDNSARHADIDVAYGGF